MLVQRARRLLLLTPLLALVLGLAAACSDDGSDDELPLTIGALVPLTGSLASYGAASQAALKLAAETINSGSGSEVNLLIEDTETDPQTALAKLESLHGRGAKVVIGPFASSEVNAVKKFADDNGIVLVSPLSTARSLAVPDDNVFRFTPDDDKEGHAAAALAWADGIRTIIAVSRNDEGNLGLQTAMKASFEKLGGKVVTGVTYPASETEFSDEMRSVAQALSGANGTGGTVGIYLTAFAEVTGVFNAANTIPALQTVKWYGSDSVALSADLVADETAAAFAMAAYYPNPILGLDEADEARWSPIQQQLASTLGRQPDSFALAAYDALMVAREALTDAGGDDAAIDDIKREFVSVANEHEGLTGPTKLNAAGDRDIAIYDFWAVCREDGEYFWYRAATHVAEGEGSISRPEKCEAS
ncbi:MAG: penicillin-binding protein activator [Dehalococcoidia bacterium]